MYLCIACQQYKGLKQFAKRTIVHKSRAFIHNDTFPGSMEKGRQYHKLDMSTLPRARILGCKHKTWDKLVPIGTVVAVHCMEKDHQNYILQSDAPCA